MSLSVLFPRVRIQELLHLRHAAVRLGAEPQLDLDQGFETRVQVRDAEIDELREFVKQLFVQGFVSGACQFRVALGAGELGGVFVRFFGEFFDAGSGGVVVEEFVIAFFYACWRATREMRGDLLVWRERERRREGGKTGKEKGKGHTFVDVGEVGAEATDRVKYRLSVKWGVLV